MRITQPLYSPKYDDENNYRCLDADVYEIISYSEAPVYCTVLCCELEEGEDTQYPLEDVLDQLNVYCSYMTEERLESGTPLLILEAQSDSLDSIRRLASLVGKRVYNYEEEGMVKLAVE